MKEKYIYEVIIDNRIRQAVKTKTFKVGDKILHMNNFDNGVESFVEANNDDLNDFSGKNGYYLRLM